MEIMVTTVEEVQVEEVMVNITKETMVNTDVEGITENMVTMEKVLTEEEDVIVDTEAMVT